MTEPTLDEVLRDQRDAIRVAVQARMRGDETVAAIAAQRDLRDNDLTSQVIGFWLEAITSDIELGSTAALEQNIGWLVRLRTGQALPFDDAMVMRMFEAISEEIDAALESDELRGEYARYRTAVETLITASFPG